MKKNIVSNLKYGFLVFTIALFVSSCSSDEGSVFNTIPEDETGGDDDDPVVEVATITFNEADTSLNVVSAAAAGEVGTTVPGRVQFNSDAINQRRMYITQNISGQGDMPFNGFDLGDTDLTKVLKADGSIDLDGSNKKDIDFTFELPVPDIENGQIVYTFWTTKGKGDFRDLSKRLALGAGTITVTVGNGTNPAAALREFTGISLFAPLADGSSETFFSFLNGETQVITDGPEFRAFWDFGYFYTPTEGASFASTKEYSTAFPFDVVGFEPDATEDDFENESLNNMSFGLSILTTMNFDAASVSGDLDSIAQPATMEINGLNVGDVIEFVDNYGKKGLIKITAITAGFNSTDFIEFDVKIQP